MSDVKSFIVKKVVPGNVFFTVSPMSNPSIRRVINLTERTPQQVLPLDWVLGFLMDQGNYTLYRKGVITFDNNDELSKIAVENGVWFEALDFTPAEDDRAAKLLVTLKAGNRPAIKLAIDKYGKDFVADVASHNIDQLTTSVVTLLESLLETQLVID